MDGGQGENELGAIGFLADTRSRCPRSAAPDLIRLPRIVCPLPHARNR